MFVGEYEGPIAPDPNEVSEFCYKSLDQIRHELATQPHLYTEWFKIAFHQVEDHWDAVFRTSNS